MDLLISNWDQYVFIIKFAKAHLTNSTQLRHGFFRCFYFSGSFSEAFSKVHGFTCVRFKYRYWIISRVTIDQILYWRPCDFKRVCSFHSFANFRLTKLRMDKLYGVKRFCGCQLESVVSFFGSFGMFIVVLLFITVESSINHFKG